MAQHTLPPLPYAYDVSPDFQYSLALNSHPQALEPVISKQIMELHHQKHHQTYINNLNGALSAQVSATQTNDVPALISLQQKIKFNGGGHINHSLFWKNLTPPGTPGNELASAAPSLREAINSRWGSQEAFTKVFNAELLGIQGSGWGWLVSKGGPKGRLEITTTKDQDPVASGDVPIFGVDMWEHAYYLQVSFFLVFPRHFPFPFTKSSQYLNNKAGYVDGIWKIINWAEAEKRYTAGVENLLKL